MDDFILLIVQEVFQKLLFFDLMILLAHQALSAAGFIISKDCTAHNFLKDKLVLLVFHLVENLTKSQSGKDLVQHLIASHLEHIGKLAFGSFLEPGQNIEEARMDA